MAEKEDNISKLKDKFSCALCLEFFKSPRTFPCFHSFCEECILKLTTLSSTDQVTKYSCPLCRKIATKEEITKNFFVSDLTELILELECGEKVCAQCDKSNADWECVDCRIILCEKCQHSHLKIPVCRAHKVLKRKGDAPILLDKILFCEEHSKEIIKFHCKTCEKPICIQCKILDHDSHKAESIDTAVKQIRQKITNFQATLRDNIAVKENEKHVIELQMKTMAKVYAETKKEIKTTEEAIIAKLKLDSQRAIDEINLQEKLQTQSFQKSLSEAQDEVKGYEGVSTWAGTLLENSQGASLIQGYYAGLYKLCEDTNDRILNANIEDALKQRTWQKPTFVKDDFLSTSLIGSVNYETGSLPEGIVPQLATKLQPELGNIPQQDGNNSVSEKSMTSQTEDQKCVQSQDTFSIANFFQNSPSLVSRFTVPSTSIPYRFAVVYSNIWIITQGQEIIPVMSLAGKLIQKITVFTSPNAVAEESHGHVIVASNKGLILYDTATKSQQQFATGQFSDITCENNLIAAVNIQSKEVIIFKKDAKSYKRFSKLNVAKAFIGRVVIQSGFINVHYQGKRLVSKYDVHGNKLSTYSTSHPSHKPSDAAKLCIVDKEGSMIFADYIHSYIEIHLRQKGVASVKLGKYEDIKAINDVAVFTNETLVVLASKTVHILKLRH